MDFQLNLDGEVDLLDAKKRLQRIEEERKKERGQEQLELFGDKEGR